MEWITNRPISHRGLHNIYNGVVENSISAFKESIKHNLPIELDIHLTKDNQIIVFHDYDLKRLTIETEYIKEVDKDYLSNIKLLDTNDTIPTLIEVLELVNGQVPILIEIKPQEVVGPLENALNELLKSYTGEVAIQSFDPYSVLWFKKNNPKILRGQLSCSYTIDIDLSPFKKFLYKNLLLNFMTKPDFIGYDVEHLDNIMVKFNRRIMKIPILAWTIKNKDDFDKAKMGADNIIYEKVEFDNN